MKTNNKQQTPVDSIIEFCKNRMFMEASVHQVIYLSLIKFCQEQAKEMEKEQSIGLIKQTAMFMAASHLDEEIANMSYEDVYKTYYEQTYGGGNQ